VPSEQAIPGDRGVAVGGGVDHHFDHPLDVTVHRGQGTDVDPEAAGDGGAHRFDVELFALDLAGLDDVLGQRRQAGLVAQSHSDIGQSSHQQTLGAADVGQRLGQGSEVVAPTWPVVGLPDVSVIAAGHAEIMGHILRAFQLFAAHLAAIGWPFRRIAAGADAGSIPPMGIELITSSAEQGCQDGQPVRRQNCLNVHAL
jgi:hypothetical protein